MQLDFTLEPFVSGIRRVGCKTLLHYFSTTLTFFPTFTIVTGTAVDAIGLQNEEVKKLRRVHAD